MLLACIMSMQTTAFHKHLERLQEGFTSLDNGSVVDYTPEYYKVEFGWLLLLHCAVLSRLAARRGSVTIDPGKSSQSPLFGGSGGSRESWTTSPSQVVILTCMKITYE